MDRETARKQLDKYMREVGVDGAKWILESLKEMKVERGDRNA